MQAGAKNNMQQQHSKEMACKSNFHPAAHPAAEYDLMKHVNTVVLGQYLLT
jgi:hypothetical protein